MTKQTKFNRLPHDEIVSLYTEDELSQNQIAKRFECSSPLIGRVLDYYNIPRRNTRDIHQKKRGKMINDAELKEQVRHLYYDKQMHMRDLLPKLKVKMCINTLMFLMDRWGMKRRNKNNGNSSNTIFDKLPAQEIIRFYVDDLLTPYEIGLKYKVSGTTIRKVLKHHNIEMRGVSESKQLWWNARYSNDAEPKQKAEPAEPIEIPEGTEEEQVRFLRDRDMFAQDIIATLNLPAHRVFEILQKL